MKVCNVCNESYDLSFFHKNKSSQDGHRNNCKSCSKSYRLKNKDIESEKKKDYYLKNKEKIDLRNKEYNNINKDVINKRSSEYQKNNLDKVKEYRREYYLNNKEKIDLKNKSYYLDNKDKILNNQKKRISSYIKRRKSECPIFKFNYSIRMSLSKCFKRNGYTKKSRTHEILGCSFEEFKIYIESKFEPWMTWDNRGLYNGELNYGWDIDHKDPISLAKTEEDIIRLNHYTNLQPLCSKINRDIKKNKLKYEMA